MENQHKKITGYRDLSQEEIDLINDIKVQGEQLRSTISNLRKYGQTTNSLELDQRWISIGETHLQQGISALVRSVAKPDSF